MAPTPALVATTSHSPITTNLREKHEAAPTADQFPLPQCVHVEAPAPENVPAAGHASHTSGEDAPSIDEYVPGEQGVLSLPPSQTWLMGHVTHVEILVCPRVSENVPASQACLSCDPPVQ